MFFFLYLISLNVENNQPIRWLTAAPSGAQGWNLNPACECEVSDTAWPLKPFSLLSVDVFFCSAAGCLAPWASLDKVKVMWRKLRGTSEHCPGQKEKKPSRLRWLTRCKADRIWEIMKHFQIFINVPNYIKCCRIRKVKAFIKHFFVMFLCSKDRRLDKSF